MSAMTTANVPYSLLHTLRACLDGTADQPAWDRAKDELDDLLLAEPGPMVGLDLSEDLLCEASTPYSPVVSAACSLCEAGHVPLTPCSDLGPRPSAQETGPIEYPITLFNDRAGVWVEWENDWHGRIVAPPETTPERRKRSS